MTKHLYRTAFVMLAMLALTGCGGKLEKPVLGEINEVCTAPPTYNERSVNYGTRGIEVARHLTTNVFSSKIKTGGARLEYLGKIDGIYYFYYRQLHYGNSNRVTSTHSYEIEITENDDKSFTIMSGYCFIFAPTHDNCIKYKMYERIFACSDDLQDE